MRIAARPGEHEEHGDDGREYRPVDEEAGEHEVALRLGRGPRLVGGGRLRAAGGAPASLIGAPGRSFATPSTITWSPGFNPLSTTHRFCVVQRDPLAERDRPHGGDRPCRPCPCRRRTRTCPACRRSPRPAARRARCCARRRGASRARTGQASAGRSRLATSARISNVPVDGLMRVSEKLILPLRSSIEPSASRTTARRTRCPSAA